MRILVVDDHGLTRRGVREVLVAHGVAVDEAASGGEALELTRANPYDAVLLDISLPDRDGLDVLKQIRSQLPHLPVLMLSMHDEEQYAVRALKAGASGYMPKGVAADLLWGAVQKIVSGGSYVSPALAESLAGDLQGRSAGEPHARLTDREFQIFRAIAEGASMRTIASTLGLSIKTVNTHRANILQKMGLRSNAELIRYAIERGLV